jgi:GNAT superfamily N-acetyltransferase
MRIRKFRKEDAQKVSNLIRKALVEVNSKDYSRKIITNLCKIYSPKGLMDITKKRDIYVAVEGDKILGTASLQGDAIYGVFVNPRYHGKGIGTKLMNYVEKVAKRRGLKSVGLPASLTAYGFYKKLGYKKFREEVTEKAGRVIIMKKKL